MTKWWGRHRDCVLGVPWVMASNSGYEGGEASQEEKMLKASLERQVGMNHGCWGVGGGVPGRHHQYHGGKTKLANNSLCWSMATSRDGCRRGNRSADKFMKWVLIQALLSQALCPHAGLHPPNGTGASFSQKGTFHSASPPSASAGLHVPRGNGAEATFFVHTKEPCRQAAAQLGSYPECYAQESEWHPIGNGKFKGFYSEK